MPYHICSASLDSLRSLASTLKFVRGKPYSIKTGLLLGCVNSQGYRQIGFTYMGFSKIYKAHHVAWFIYYGCVPSNVVDHKDGVGDNNTKRNLRDVTNAQNQQNRKISQNNALGVKGVCRHPYGFKASITLNRCREVKYFKVFEDAVAWRTSRSQALHPFDNTVI